MEVKISKRLNSRIKNISQILGFEKDEMVERALLFYLDIIQKQLDLKKEFQEWDKLSNEALVNFEELL